MLISYKPGNYLSALMDTIPIFKNSANILSGKGFRIKMGFSKY